jgi:hypothetical protein
VKKEVADPAESVPAQTPTPPAEETVTGPTLTPKQTVPTEWWKKQAAPTEEPVTPADTATQDSAVDILVGAVDLLHDRAAQATGYGYGPNPDGTGRLWGWTLTEKEIELWRKVLKFLLRRLKMKDWDIIVALVGLVIAEGSKVMGYLQYRKNASPVGGDDKRQLVRNSPKVPDGVMGGDLAEVSPPEGGDMAGMSS